MTTSERLEQETEQTREQIAATLDELRARMTPGSVVDQLFDYAQDSSGGMFFQNLRQQVVNNPLPVALMGAGLAWLAFANRSGPGNGARTNGGMDGFGRRTRDTFARSADAAGEWTDQASGVAADTASDMSGRVRQAGADVVDSASSAYEQAKDSALSSYDAAAETASSTYESAVDRASAAASRLKQAAGSAAETASGTYDAAAERLRRTGDKVGQSAARMRDSMSGAGRDVMNFFNEQPLVLAGLGIALGAVLGAALPSTETEDELMGEESDALKDQAGRFADQQIDKGKSVVGHAVQSAKEEGAGQGLMPDKADAAASTPDRHAEAGKAAPYAQGATGGGEEATLVPSAGEGHTEDHKLERSGT